MAGAVRSVRMAGWLRVAYESALVVVCGGVNAFLTIAFSADTLETDLGVLIPVGVAGFLASALILPLRLVHPIAALVLGGLTSIPTAGASLTLIALSAAAGYRAQRASAIVLGYLSVLVCCTVGVTLEARNDPVYIALISLTSFCAVTVVPGAIGAMVAQRRLLVMTMHQRNLELHAERRLAVGQAQARERNRIAAELHDSLGHRLTLISLYAGGLAQAQALPGAADAKSAEGTESPERQQAVGMLRDTSAQAMGELRQILRILHQDGQQEDAGRSLGEVEQTVTSARATGTPVELFRAGQPRPLNLLAEHAAFRVVQEGITNALKHAGGAPVRVEVRYDEDALFVEVRNGPGRPYPGPSTGQGLAGLAERVRLAGGVLSSGRTDDEGFRIGALLPYEAEVPGPAPDDVGDFPRDIERSSRRQRNGMIAVITAGVLSLASCVGATTLPTPLERVPQRDFDRAQIGDSEDTVREYLPFDTVRPSVGDWESEICDTYLGDPEVEPPEGTEIHYEFCFENYELKSKQEIEAQI